MKKLILLLCSLSFLTLLSAQEIVGSWGGNLKLPGMELRLIFHVEKTAADYSATMDSPDQGAFGIVCDAVSWSDEQLDIELKSLQVTYSGKLNGDTLEGTFSQMGMSFPLLLHKLKEKPIAPIRPQEPQPPFSYYTEDVFFENKKEDIRLAGTLSLPSKKGEWPVVVLISGSGPQDRNEEIMGHKPFLVIADFLTKNDIGVLRFDDRGTAQSGGNFAAATSENFANDVEAAIAYLLTRKEVDKNKIGLIGHSEGGIIAPMVAARNENVSFIVLLAGTGVRGDELLLQQTRAIAEASGASAAIIEQTQSINRALYNIVLESEDDTLNDRFQLFFDVSEDENPLLKGVGSEQKEQLIQSVVQQLNSPWMRYFIRHDPAPVLEQVKCPVLAINGSLDLQVPAEENLSAIQNALRKGNNKQFKVVEMKELNHLFQEASTGLPSEYMHIEQTFSPKVLEVILEWIREVM